MAKYNTPEDTQWNQISLQRDMNLARSSNADMSHLLLSNSKKDNSNTSNRSINNSKLFFRVRSSTIKEINELLASGEPEVADKSKTQDLPVFELRFVVTVKHEGFAHVLDKSCLVVQSFND